MKCINFWSELWQMKTSNTDDLIMAVVIATILFFLMIAFIVSYFIIYRRKKQEHLFEMKLAKEEFHKQLFQSQLEIQEQTFNHISQEIHDNVGQILSLAKVQINIMNESDNMSKEMLNEVKENVGKALSDLRDIAKSLSSERINSMSITDAVRIEAERISKSGIIHASVSCEGEERKMDEQKKQILFRIVQECLQNIIKHAQASEVNLHFNYMPDCLDVCVKDNGKGFDVNKAISNSTGLGLQNINTRASLIGGSFAIESTLSEGSTVTIKIPYE